MKKMMAIVFCLLLFFTACTARSVITVAYPVPEAEPSSVASAATNTSELSSDGINVILTSTQKVKIEALLTGALNMSSYCTGRATFFNEISSLSTDDFLEFVYIILDFESDSIGREYMGTGTISSKDVKTIIRSAFGVDYIPKEGDSAGEGLLYSGGSFDFEADDGVIIDAHPYSFTRQSSDRLMVKLNMTYGYIPGTSFEGKAEAVLQEDANSLFGYRLVSLTEVNVTDIAFTSAEASSYLPANGLDIYAAANAIDGDDSTAWVTQGGKGEWIRLSFDKPENMTGLILNFGDWSSDEAFAQHAMPSYCRIEFSDGSFFEGSCEPQEIGDDNCFTFQKVISTSYVIITITDITEGNNGTNGGVYVSDIKPF